MCTIMWIYVFIVIAICVIFCLCLIYSIIVKNCDIYGFKIVKKYNRYFVKWKTIFGTWGGFYDECENEGYFNSLEEADRFVQEKLAKLNDRKRFKNSKSHVIKEY